MKQESKTRKAQHESFSEQFEKNLGLKEWKRWFFRTMFVSGLIFFGYISEESVAFGVSLLDAGIYGALILTAVMALYLSFKDAKFIEIQTKLATEQVELLHNLDDISEFVDVAKESIFKSHIENLYRIFEVHPDINQDNLVEILHSRLMARNRNVELLSSVLITLGLVGTIIGLILMTDDLSMVMQNLGTAETSEIMQTLAGKDGPLGSLGVAFYTTLLGAVFGGVILRILANVVQASISRYTAHIAELTEVNVLPPLRQMAKRLEKHGYYEVENT